MSSDNATLIIKGLTLRLPDLHAISAAVGEGRCRSLTGGLDAYVAAGCLERLRRAEVGQ